MTNGQKENARKRNRKEEEDDTLKDRETEREREREREGYEITKRERKNGIDSREGSNNGND